MQLKEILYIITAPIVHEKLANYLELRISAYLTHLIDVAPGYLKPKHHILLHYPSVMKRKGPLLHLSTMRCESKNRDLKTTSHISLNRLNICKTLANVHENKIPASCALYDRGSFKKMKASELPDHHLYANILPVRTDGEIRNLQSITFKNHKLTKNVVLMQPEESENSFFLIHAVIEDCHSNLFIIAKEFTEYVHYDEHYQAYKVDESVLFDENSWRCFAYNDMKALYISRLVSCKNAESFVPKRWV